MSEIAKMTPEQVRRALFDALGYEARPITLTVDFDVYQGETLMLKAGTPFVCWMVYRDGKPLEDITNIVPIHETYETEKEALDALVPDWPSDPGAALALLDGPGEALRVEIYAQPDGRVMVFDARYNVLSSLKEIKTHQCYSWPDLTEFAVKVADAASRCALVALTGGD